MHLPTVLKAGFALLPPAFKGAYKEMHAETGSLPTGQGTLLSFQVNNVELKFSVYYASQISHLQLNYIIRDAADARKETGLPTLVVCPVIYPKIAQKLVNMNVNYLDSLGNVYINEKTIYLQHTGQKPKRGTASAKSRLFGESGLKLLFALLQDEEAINFPYREIAKIVGISPASITILFKEMLKSGYLFEDYVDSKRLLRKRDLLQRWVTGYIEILRPKLFIGTYQMIKQYLIKDFDKLPLSDWQGSWGGEAAGALYTKYLVPQVLTMYVPAEEKGWMKKMGLIPIEENHDLEVYSYFWDHEHPLFRVENNLAPPLIVYAELMATGDSRNQETAQKIYDEYLQFIER